MSTPAELTCPNLGLQHSKERSPAVWNGELFYFAIMYYPTNNFASENILEAGLEPAISSLGGRRLIH